MTESNNHIADGQEGRARRITRRVFLRNMSMTAAAFVANACGGGSADSTDEAADPQAAPLQQNLPASAFQTAAGNRAPAWNEIPTITFTQGVASAFSVAAFISDDDNRALTILKNELALPSGVTYDPATKSFVYDGIGSIGVTSGHVLTAMEG